MDHAYRLERLAKSALGIKDGFPGVCTDQKACPERHDNEQEQERLVPARSCGQEIDQRVAYDQTGKGTDKRHAHCHRKEIEIQWVGELLVVIRDEAGLD